MRTSKKIKHSILKSPWQQTKTQVLNRQGPCHQFSYFHNNEQTQKQHSAAFPPPQLPLASCLPCTRESPRTQPCWEHSTGERISLTNMLAFAKGKKKTPQYCIWYMNNQNVWADKRPGQACGSPGENVAVMSDRAFRKYVHNHRQWRPWPRSFKSLSCQIIKSFFLSE